MKEGIDGVVREGGGVIRIMNKMTTSSLLVNSHQSVGVVPYPEGIIKEGETSDIVVWYQMVELLIRTRELVVAAQAAQSVSGADPYLVLIAHVGDKSGNHSSLPLRYTVLGDGFVAGSEVMNAIIVATYPDATLPILYQREDGLNIDLFHKFM